MIDYISQFYLWYKFFHIVSVISWMAGLLYLPRLFVYHTEEVYNLKQCSLILQTMERRLYKLIMVPAMVSSWFFGILLILSSNSIDFGSLWPWIKGIAVIAMTWFHFWLDRRRKDFIVDKIQLSGRTYRIMNEFPTVLMLVIVAMVVVKPF